MKTTLTLLITLLLTLTTVAQQGINYKALIKDGSGNVVASQGITVQFQILQGAGMTNVYQETHTPNTDANGMVILNIGEGTTSDVFTDIDWGSDDHYLNVQINTGSGLTDMGTTQFMAVPYALSAANAATKIDDLSDGYYKSDDSSLFLGELAGFNDDGEDNHNLGFGYAALYNNTTGGYNMAIGELALVNNLTGDGNIAIGNGALLNSTAGDDNTAIGLEALGSNLIGSNNTANGAFALSDNTTGRENTAIGAFSLSSLSGNAFGNSAIGYESLNSLTDGIFNTALGNNALSNLTSGTNNIGIGSNAQPSSPTVSNEVTIGNTSHNVYRMYASGWTNASDAKLKHAIQNIPLGLDFVMKLRPVEFIYNNANNEEKTFGFIAQEVKEAVKQSNLVDNILVSLLNKEYLGLRTTELISVLTKAIQEQQDLIVSQKKEIETLTAEQKSTNNRLNKIETLLNTSQQ